ncbi:MAG: metallophosphoesterase family protein [Desulfobulbus sp.]|jgi:predicted phosphodiesterase|uniref:metallophosphoesterase family protein n=1 Tax=Desulfobulbus sp. TaxID=895 RepID=UPI00284F19FF|nr:metallophosphoesterase family protein [Desulfobulbus sp.]MDR2550215.1 metallophosphoesterase family protein [Desulfobulbus sp.]
MPAVDRPDEKPIRLGILADIHGNYRALAAVLADMAQAGVERIVSLGDNIGYGPEPEEVVRALIEHRVVSVMGNHELGLFSRSYCKRLHAVARDSLALTRTLLSPESLAWLEALPAVLCDGGVRYVHGCPPRSATIYLYEPTENRLQRVFASYSERFCFAGHTHDFGWYRQTGTEVASQEVAIGQVPLEPDARYLLKPGSVGQPRDLVDWHAKYMIWDQAAAAIDIRSVPYDVQTTIRLLGERGFPASNAKRLYW